MALRRNESRDAFFKYAMVIFSLIPFEIDPYILFATKQA
jgi:hypothetical protein